MSPRGFYSANGRTAGPEFFSSSKYGVEASPRVAFAGPMPRGGGRDQVGNPYTVRGTTYVPTVKPKKVEVGYASWYGAAFHGRLTANGEVYDMNHLTAAHKTMPLPSYAKVTNLDNGRSLIVRVNDRGPFEEDRVIDLSKMAADLLGYSHDGTAKVKVEYAGRAPLDGQDDSFLMASVKGVPGFPSHDRFGAPASSVMIAMNGSTPLRGSVSPAAAALMPPAPLPAAMPTMAEATLPVGGRSPLVVFPTQIPLPGERPDFGASGVAVSAYASMRVATAFDAVPLGAAAVDWKRH